MDRGVLGAGLQHVRASPDGEQREQAPALHMCGAGHARAHK